MEIRETELSSKIIHELRYVHDLFVFNIHGGGFQPPGMPDCLIIQNGVHIFVEWKGPQTKLRTLQDRVIKELKESGANVFVVRFIDDRTWRINEKEDIGFNKWKDGVVLLLDRLVELSE